MAGTVEVSCCVGLVNNEVVRLGHHQERNIYCINLLKHWHAHKGYLMAPYPNLAKLEPPPVEAVFPEGSVFEEHLSQGQEYQLQGLVTEFQDVFCAKPRETRGIVYWIATATGCIIQETWR